MRASIAAGWLMTALLFLPALLLSPAAPPSAAPPEPVDPPPAAAEEAPRSDDEVTVRVWNGEAVEALTLASYLPGVVRGEMPASFEPEALAAQAVAERTCVLYQMAHGPKAAHPEADVCTDPACCTAWLSEAEARQRWGGSFEEYDARIRRAVERTDGQVILYDGVPILAAFHSSSDGLTAASGEVWQADLPYLRSVSSPESGDTVPNYYSVVTVAVDVFRETFLAAYPSADLSGDPAGWLGDVRRNDSGRVESAEVGGVTVSGAALRGLFALRSASFTVSASAEGVTFRVTGYGHGVGMSQYGANELARQGKTWQEILQWYYTGVTIGAMG
ncbi:MAG: stage II sporulation protein D [Ruminococcaceae bacterium]|nr:stage II sporulation protein D [Oscillospiraceae bacterium]